MFQKHRRESKQSAMSSWQKIVKGKKVPMSNMSTADRTKPAAAEQQQVLQTRVRLSDKMATVAEERMAKAAACASEKKAAKAAAKVAVKAELS